MNAAVTQLGLRRRLAVRVERLAAVALVLVVGVECAYVGRAVASDAPMATNVIVTGTVRIPSAWGVHHVDVAMASTDRGGPAYLTVSRAAGGEGMVARFGGLVRTEGTYVIDVSPVGFRLLRHVTRASSDIQIDVPPPAPICIHVAEYGTGADLPDANVFWYGEVEDAEEQFVRRESFGWNQAEATGRTAEFRDFAPVGHIRVLTRLRGYVTREFRGVVVRVKTGLSLDVRMLRAGRLAVRVVGTEASGVEGRLLHVHPEPELCRASRFCRIFDRRCEIDDIEAGTYTVWVAGSDGAPISAPKMVRIAAGASETVEVEVTRREQETPQR